jgi:hypothetical protein
MHSSTDFFLNLDRLGYGAEAVDVPLTWSAERALMRAVLHDAIDMLLRHRHATGRKQKRLFQEAYDWCWSDDALYVFSFVCICESLQVEPSYLRSGLKKALTAPPTEQKQRYKLRMHHLAYMKYHVGDVDTLGRRKKAA